MKSEQQRITELEVSLAHLQRQYDVLNDVVTDLNGQLDRTTKRIEKWERGLDQLKSAVEQPTDPMDEKPPHY